MPLKSSLVLIFFYLRITRTHCWSNWRKGYWKKVHFIECHWWEWYTLGWSQVYKENGNENNFSRRKLVVFNVLNKAECCEFELMVKNKVEWGLAGTFFLFINEFWLKCVLGAYKPSFEVGIQLLKFYLFTLI